MKKCPPGEYYCNDSKKCKRIPRGYHVGARGHLEHDDDNGKKNGNGNGTNGTDIQMVMETALMVVAVV